MTIEAANQALLVTAGTLAERLAAAGRQRDALQAEVTALRSNLLLEQARRDAHWEALRELAQAFHAAEAKYEASALADQACVAQLQDQLEALRTRARDLQDALTHAHHEKAEVDGKLFMAGVRAEDLRAENARLVQRLQVGHVEFIRVSQQGLAYKRDLQDLLDAVAALEAKAPPAGETPAPLAVPPDNVVALPDLPAGRRRQLVINGAIRRAFARPVPAAPQRTTSPRGAA